MQICQEKGKHANGPYGMRVRGRVRRKEEVTRVLGGPAPDVFLWRISEGGAGHLYHSAHQPTGNAAHLDVRADPGQPDGVAQTRNSCYLWKKIIWGNPKKSLKEYELPPKWREVWNTNSQWHPHSQCQEKMLRDREGTGAWERGSCGPPWSLPPLTSRCQMLHQPGQWGLTSAHSVLSVPGLLMTDPEKDYTRQQMLVLTWTWTLIRISVQVVDGKGCIF